MHGHRSWDSLLLKSGSLSNPRSDPHLAILHLSRRSRHASQRPASGRYAILSRSRSIFRHRWMGPMPATWSPGGERMRFGLLLQLVTVLMGMLSTACATTRETAAPPPVVAGAAEPAPSPAPT